MVTKLEVVVAAAGAAERRHTENEPLCTRPPSSSVSFLQVVVESRAKAPGTVAMMHIGKLSLVDLAGSERSEEASRSVVTAPGAYSVDRYSLNNIKGAIDPM